MSRLLVPALFAFVATAAPRAQPVSFVAGERLVTCQTPEHIGADGEVPLTLTFKPDGSFVSVASHGDARPLTSEGAGTALGCTAEARRGGHNESVRTLFRFESGAAQALQIVAQPPRPPSDSDLYEFVEHAPALVGGITRFQAGIAYPEDARRAGVEGRVYVQFIVEQDGTVSHVTVVRSVFPSLDAAAAQAVQRARFEPGREGRRRVRTRQTLPVSFAIR